MKTKLTLMIPLLLLSVGCSRLPADWKVSTQQPTQQIPQKELNLEQRIVAASSKMATVPGATPQPSPELTELPSPEPTATPINFYPEETKEGEQKDAYLLVWRAANLRSTPSMGENQIIEVIPANTQVAPIGQPLDGWIRAITPTGREGYIHYSNIKW